MLHVFHAIAFALNALNEPRGVRVWTCWCYRCIGMQFLREMRHTWQRNWDSLSFEVSEFLDLFCSLIPRRFETGRDFLEGGSLHCTVQSLPLNRSNNLRDRFSLLFLDSKYKLSLIIIEKDCDPVWLTSKRKGWSAMRTSKCSSLFIHPCVCIHSAYPWFGSRRKNRRPILRPCLWY